jgi:hypothetical protein
MTEQAMPRPSRVGRANTRIMAPEVGVRVVGAMLALAIAAVHVADQGGITVLNTPHWIGWGYRVIEVGGECTAVAHLMPRQFMIGPAWLPWAAGILLGVGPLLGYIASRTIGLPGDPGDVGNWGYWVGTVSMLIEAATIMLSVSMVLALRRSYSS